MKRAPVEHGFRMHSSAKIHSPSVASSVSAGKIAPMDDSRHDDHELHRNLVVRVRGWSGCFCELDGTYQDRIIGLHNYGAERCGTQ